MLISSAYTSMLYACPTFILDKNFSRRLDVMLGLQNILEKFRGCQNRKQQNKTVKYKKSNNKKGIERLFPYMHPIRD